MMRRSAYLVALASVSLVATARQARALWVEEQLTPKTLGEAKVSFKIETKSSGALKEFTVAVAPKSGTLSPVLTARLHVMQGGTEIAAVPVEERWSGGKVSYWFRIAPQFLADSKFEFGEHGYAETPGDNGKPHRDEHGRPVYVGLPGGRGYWFYLRDFASS